MKKVTFLLIALCFIVSSCFAQNNYHGFHGFFSHLQRPAPAYKKFRSMATATITPDSTFRGFRPIGSLVVQAYPGGSTLAGIGLDYEYNTYTSSTQTWYTKWALGLLLYAGGTIAPTSPNSVVAGGLNLSLFNKRISLGGAYDFVNKRPLLTFGTTISFVAP